MENGISEKDMEKNGSILLTEEDLNLFSKGQVSERIKTLWNLSFNELEEVINNNYYRKI
jgi:hypothetical protein